MMPLALALALLAAAPAPAPEGDPCSGRVADARPGTAAWVARDAQNVACAEQRAADTAPNAALAEGASSPLRDKYRDPGPFAGHRFRYDTATVVNRAGVPLAAEIFRPCTATTCAAVPAGLTVADGPYPAVVIVHGGASNKELHRWASQALAESGYLTVAFDVAENGGGDHATDAQDVVDWLFGERFPFAADLRRDRVGIAGHSQGASTASLLGQLDPRLKAIVAWDNLTALSQELWADDIGVDPPAKVDFHAPALGIGADYYFVPRPYGDAPEPAPSNGEGGRGRGFSAHPKDLGYQEVKAAGPDTALFVMRAATHLDFTPTTTSPSSRWGEATATYLTLAWFDRYLRGLDDPALARDAHRRLVGTTVFDGSADVHAIGSGRLDPATLEPSPWRIAGTSVCDRMSFYFRSRSALRPPEGGARVEDEDWRASCYAGAAR